MGKKIDRSIPLGILYVFIRFFGLFPIAFLREILLIFPICRKAFFKLFKYLMYRQLETRKEFPYRMQQDKYNLMMAIFNMTMRTIFHAKTNHVKRQRLHMFLNIFLRRLDEIERFRKERGEYPPGFLVIGVGKYCNLNCTGCYANSDTAASEKLDWDVLDRMVAEKKKQWGSYFTVITGGEPMLYKSKGKTIFDLAEKYPDQLFMFYTNGTLIDDKAIKRMNELGNISPAISVEGFEKETDERRGKGTFQKIVNVMKKLDQEGVGYGISVTATNQNIDTLTNDEFYDFFFKECGASYGWIFQYMPIGREKALELLVSPEQRIQLFRTVQRLIKEKQYFITDFWNSGTCVEGCISAGRFGGFLYVDWNGNVTPCTFNPYSPVNIYDAYKEGKTLTDILDEPFFKDIREWQKNYGTKQPKDKIGNWITPCISKDHYKDLRPLIDKHQPKPIDESAKEALEDENYKKGMIKHGEELKEKIGPIWEEEYLEEEEKEKQEEAK